MVEEARRKLLQEHAEALAGFLPKGVIASEEEQEIMRNASRNASRGSMRSGFQ